jgi:glucokinase
MNYLSDNRVVLTLDAGGTNFVFSAIQGNKEVVEPVRLPSQAHDLDLCIQNIIKGFSRVNDSLDQKPSAISFAFPGPADYPKGIIGDLGNLPAFRGGIALGPFLEKKFNLPVYINNDGDLYAFGEAMFGFLPYINDLLAKAGSNKQYRNLIGFTLGTGFGAGIVHNGNILLGDNSGAGEVWLLRNKLLPQTFAEEGVSIRAVQREYAEYAEIPIEIAPSPKEIFEIGTGKLNGNKQAAIKAYDQMGEILGDAVANVVTLIDGLVVIGGGLAGASPLFMESMIKEMNSSFSTLNGDKVNRLATKVYNLENYETRNLFLKGTEKEINIPGSMGVLKYDPVARVGVGISKIGTSRAISLGAYAFALKQLDRI